MEVRDLQVAFHTPDGPVKAVNKVSFHLLPGEVLALVGESGSGKTVTSLALTQLLGEKNTEISGLVTFNGIDLLSADRKTLRGSAQPKSHTSFKILSPH